MERPRFAASANEREAVEMMENGAKRLRRFPHYARQEAAMAG